jgi:hypothetical protein
MSWFPESDETLRYQGPVVFASGLAAKVATMRWFRDEAGRDIAAELPGWPEGPVYTPRSDKQAQATTVLGGIGKGIVVVAAMAVNAVSNANPNVSFGADVGRPTDPAREVDDFPVLVATPGTIARTLPYQLDPDRRGPRYTTELVVTEHRVLVLGADRDAGPAPSEVLWEAPRGVLASVVLHAHGNGDLTLVFEDGSWARLRLWEGAVAAIQVTAELCPAKRVELGELALKKLKTRAAPTKLPYTWEAVVRDDGSLVAQRVLDLDGRTARGPNQYPVTKWVEVPASGA